MQEKEKSKNNGRLTKIENFRRLEHRKAYKPINNLKNGFEPHTNLCKDKNGNIIAAPEHITGRWKEHFGGLFNAITTRLGLRRII
jgi:hypothetical protein